MSFVNYSKKVELSGMKNIFFKDQYIRGELVNPAGVPFTSHTTIPPIPLCFIGGYS